MATPFAGLRVLVTAGPTREPIDAVRFISNRSSGRMGTALAAAAAKRGHRVTLLLGRACPPLAGALAATDPACERGAPTDGGPAGGSPEGSLQGGGPQGGSPQGGSPTDAGPAPGRPVDAPPLSGRPPAVPVALPPRGPFPAIATRRFDTTADLASALDQLWPHHDVLLMAAAVSDHRPVLDPAELAASGGKLSRRAGAFTLRLEPTPDLLAALAERSRPDQTLIGFALEPADRLRASAMAKLRRKGIHGIVANPLETMDAADVSGTLLLADGRQVSPAIDPVTKERFAAWLIEAIEGLRRTGPADSPGRPGTGLPRPS